jgi:hypothetical protein
MVIFVKADGKWVLMTLDELTDKMVDSSKDIEKTIAESRKGFKKGIKRNLEFLGHKLGD